jgi:hypothetical protein
MSDTTKGTADTKAHVDTWVGFKAMMTWGTVAAAIIAAFVVVMIAPK